MIRVLVYASIDGGALPILRPDPLARDRGFATGESTKALRNAGRRHRILGAIQLWYRRVREDIPPQSHLFPFSNQTNMTGKMIMRKLREDLWLDRSTRIISVEMTFHNTMSQLLTSARFTIEVLPTGYLQPYYIIRTLNPVLVEFDIAVSGQFCDGHLISRL